MDASDGLASDSGRLWCGFHKLSWFFVKTAVFGNSLVRFWCTAGPLCGHTTVLRCVWSMFGAPEHRCPIVGGAVRASATRSERFARCCGAVRQMFGRCVLGLADVRAAFVRTVDVRVVGFSRETSREAASGLPSIVMGL